MAFKLFNTLIVFMKEFIEKVNCEKKHKRLPSIQRVKATLVRPNKK